MKINDKRKQNVSVFTRDGLSQGKVYQDCYGNVVISTDEGSVVDLEYGILHILSSHYTLSNTFTEINATLQIS